MSCSLRRSRTPQLGHRLRFRSLLGGSGIPGTQDKISGTPINLSVVRHIMHRFVRCICGNIESEVQSTQAQNWSTVLLHTEKDLVMHALCISAPVTVFGIFSLFTWYISSASEISTDDVNIPVMELNALWDFYNATNGKYWIWQNPNDDEFFQGNAWNFSVGANPCADEWQGLTCSPVSGQFRYVVALVLPDHHLNGVLTEAIGNLTHLQELALSNNHISGTLPLSPWSTLAQLTVLDIFNNFLDGTIPTSLNSLQSLQYLNLGENFLKGNIPSQLANLRQLKTLSLVDNYLLGAIPSSIWLMPSLETLVLAANFLHGALPEEVNCTKMQNLLLGDNQLFGTIPDSIASLLELEELGLSYNALNGTLPAGLSALGNLSVLSVSYNHLNGSFPDVVLTLTSLTKLGLAGNNFNGTIPEEIGRLTHLERLDAIPSMQSLLQLYMGQNRLNGSVPATLEQLLWLQTLDIGGNMLSGTIPTALCSLMFLEVLDLYRNSLTGSIPNCIGDMTNLQDLELSSNALHGTIPQSLGSLPYLRILYLDDNDLHGRIPPALGNAGALEYIQLSNNDLHGTIPGELVYPKGLLELSLSGNRLHGIIPAGIGHRLSLLALVLDQNQLTGSLPVSLYKLLQIQFLSVSYNHLTGHLPMLWANFGQLLDLNLAGNHFIGTIPSAVGSLPSLLTLQMQENILSGPIPDTLGSLAAITVLNIGSNTLEGSIPATLARLSTLEQLYLDTNRLTGGLNSSFSVESQRFLQIISVANNQLGGPLPDNIFQLANLSILIAAHNCFTGNLPEGICAAMKLVSLNLDGLHTADHCVQRLVPKTYIYKPLTGLGTIPSCILRMPTLASLHLSGNSISGTIPEVRSSNTSLIDMVLSQNDLVGTIPASVQSHNWRNLDLSFNRIRGTLHSDFGAAFNDTVEVRNGYSNTSSYHSVVLKNNRLSGRIPSALVHMEKVSILDSNIFSCKIDRSDLPQSNDETDREHYQCASDAFVRHLYASLAVVCVLVSLWIFRKHWWGNLQRLLERIEARLQEIQLKSETLPPNMQLISAISSVLCNVGTVCTLLIVGIFTPWYSIAHAYFGTHTHEYAWVVSAAFLSGLAPAITSLVLYCVFMCAMVIFAANLVRRKDNRERMRARSSAPRVRAVSMSPTAAPPVPVWQRRIIYMVFFVTNLFVVLLANVGFVAATLKANNFVVAVVQLLFSLFKLVWNMVCTPYMIDLVTAYTCQERISPSMVTIYMFMALVTNIAIPCLVVAAQSPSCFLELFEGPDPVIADYIIPGCSIEYQYTTNNYTTVCSYRSPVKLSLEFEPLFSYDYQCSSSFITYYAPAFVYMGLAAGIGLPIGKVVALRLLQRATPGTWWHQLLSFVVPRILKPVECAAAGPAVVPPLVTPAVRVDRDPRALAFQRIRSGRYFDASNQISTLVTYLGILLTFGVVFPPLAVVMCATMWSVDWQTRIIIGRFMHNAKEIGALHLLDNLERDCKATVSVKNLRRILFLTVCICCCFYALFLFDTLGDAQGWFHSYWILFAMSLFPLLLFILNRGHRRLRGKLGFAGRTGFYLDDNMFEMVTIGPALETSEDDQEEQQEKPPEAHDVKPGEDNVRNAETISAIHLA